MRRRLFTLAAGISLLLCAATVALRIWSVIEALEYDRVQLRLDDSWVEYRWMASQGRVGLQWRVPGPVPTFRPLNSSSRFRRLPPYRFDYEHPPRMFLGKNAGAPWSIGHESVPGAWGHRAVWCWGFEYSRLSFQKPLLTDRLIWLPDWLLVTTFAVLPIYWLVTTLIGWRRSRRKRCRACGYSLQGNTSGVCPECGTPVPKAPDDKNPRTA